VVITESEGNGRMCLTLPETLIAVAGIDKVVPRFQDLEVLFQLLPRSATGERMNPYNSIWTGVDKSRAGGDGPRAFHIVLMDNARTSVLADREARQTLNCIRCGACLNICPIFRQVGGHTYGTIYPGPIGSIYTPRTVGLGEWGHLSYACSLCTACKGVCPVKIDLPKQLLITRRDFIAAGNIKPAERAGFAGFRWAIADAGRFRMLGWLGRKALSVVRALGLSGTVLDPMHVWTKYRSPVALPRQSFREWWRENGNR